MGATLRLAVHWHGSHRLRRVSMLCIVRRIAERIPQLGGAKIMPHFLISTRGSGQWR
jgi:hypothetical protein